MLNLNYTGNGNVCTITSISSSSSPSFTSSSASVSIWSWPSVSDSSDPSETCSKDISFSEILESTLSWRVEKIRENDFLKKFVKMNDFFFEILTYCGIFNSSCQWTLWNIRFIQWFVILDFFIIFYMLIWNFLLFLFNIFLII